MRKISSLPIKNVELIKVFKSGDLAKIDKTDSRIIKTVEDIKNDMMQVEF